MMDLERVREIADEMIPGLVSGGKIFVAHCSDMRQHRLIEIWWDSFDRDSNGRSDCRGTAVDISDTEDMVRYRIRAVFANEDGLQRVGPYECVYPTVVDHPDEPPPYGPNVPYGGEFDG